MIIYIFNLHDGVGDVELKQLFVPFGEVKTAQVAKDVISGESRGFGYVELEDEKAGQNAIKHLNGLELETLTIYVQENSPEGSSVVKGTSHFHPISFYKN